MDWKKYIAPGLLVTLIISLTAYIWTGLAKNVEAIDKKATRNKVYTEQIVKEACKESEERDKELDAKKVDNKTMQLQIQLQQMQIEANKAEFTRIYKELEAIKK